MCERGDNVAWATEIEAQGAETVHIQVLMPSWGTVCTSEAFVTLMVP